MSETSKIIKAVIVRVSLKRRRIDTYLRIETDIRRNLYRKNDKGIKDNQNDFTCVL